jgi:hypothetical protein
MKNRVRLFALAVVLAAVTVSCGLTQDMSAVSDTGNAFMTALKDGDHAKSYALLAPDLQTELGGTLESWTEFATPRNFSQWSFSNTKLENDTGQLDGEATLSPDTYTVSLVLKKVNNEWKIAGIDIKKK